MNKKNYSVLALALVAILSQCLFGDGTVRTNPPSACSDPQNGCGCPKSEDEEGKGDGTEGEKSQNDGDSTDDECIKVWLGLGRTTPWTGSMSCSLKIFADDESSSIFTCESLYAVLGGYTFKRLGQKTLADGVTPAEVVMSHPRGESVHFVFAEGESWGRPDPGVHIKMDERLMMVDAEGWATTSDPVYYDLYVGDGTRRRFLATNMTGALGQLVSITDARGVTVTPEDMGVDIVYDSNGVRQFLTPSRLADIVQTADFSGYDIAVYAIDAVPAKDAATGLYAPPAAMPVKRLSLRSANGGKRAIVTIRRGGGEPMVNVFDYAMGEWSLTRPSGAKEEKERLVQDKKAAQIVKEVKSPFGELLSRRESNFKWMSWGFAMTNRVEGFDGVTDTTTWTYYTSGNGKGQVKSEKRQSGLLTQYVYDNLDRLVSQTRSGPGMMTEVTTYDYTPVDPSDPILPVDTRPRMVVKTLNGIECERTYYVYSPLTNIVERVGTQGAAYGGTNVLRTVTTFYPVSVGASLRDARSGFVASIRHEDGRLDLYDYELSSNCWIRTVTHLHEQSLSPVSGKTTRDITITNARGETSETRTEAYIDGIWYTISRNSMTYNSEGKRITSENLAGQVTTTAWDCCHKVSETQPDGPTTTWDYDAEGRMIASSRLIPLDMTNVTWLTTCFRYDDLGRQVATWQTNYAAQVGLPATRTRYDVLGRVIARVDQLGNTTTTSYSPDGRTVSVLNPNTSTLVTSRSAEGDTLSITGTAATPEFHTYGILPDGTRWFRIVQGETANSPRFTKRYENLLGQTILEERSGFKGAVLATTHNYDSLGRLVSTSPDYEPTTEYTYDNLGNRVAKTSRTGGSPVQWRRTSTESCFALDGDTIWLTQTNIVSCSDSAIAPLVTSFARQLTGLTTALPARSRTTDIRENITENETLVDSFFVTSRQALPYATNKPLSISRYGVSLMDVSVSAVTNSVTYDSLGRQIANTDGRGNTRHTEYNALGQRSASIDALGNRTTYAYDQFGNLAAVTNPLGHAIVYEYDLRGRKTYEGGATYPVRYTYDVFGNKTTMMTYRNESLGPDSGDVTTWLYDEASGAMTNKVYADGKGPSYSYTPDGKLSRRTWARGIVTDYSYDSWGNLTNKVYSDDTPAVFIAYDALGRQSEVHDAAGVTTFLYDSFGSITNETMIGVAGTNTIERFWDDFDRAAGYSLNGTRQTSIGYDSATARIGSMLANGSDRPFTWSYLPGADLKTSLTYPNGLIASWQYDANNRLLQVCNATPTNVISQYDNIYDVIGRRISCSHSGSVFIQPDTIAYGYNNRSELTNVVASVDVNYRYSYQYDDIGNRKTSIESSANSIYVANQLNQYTLIDDFVPEFDDDGNQTLIKTATGVWTIRYNGENRPISWSNGATNITMKYDYMARRIEYIETVDAIINANQHFIYDGYLCVQRCDASANAESDIIFCWDATEPIATRPLWFLRIRGFHQFFYLHDGNKNVSEVISYRPTQGILWHYKYAPFGHSTVETTNIFYPAFNVAHANTFRFMSEHIDDALAAYSYVFRCYGMDIGRFYSRDIMTDFSYSSFGNNTILEFDYLGLIGVTTGVKHYKKQRYLEQTQKVVCEWRWDVKNKKCDCLEPCRWEDSEGKRITDRILVTVSETYYNGITPAELAKGIAGELVGYVGDKTQDELFDILLKCLIGKSLPAIPFLDEIQALDNSEYKAYLQNYLSGGVIEYDGKYYQRLVRTVTYENTFWIPRPQHLIVPSCKTIGQLETIGTAIGKPYWTDDRGF